MTQTVTSPRTATLFQMFNRGIVTFIYLHFKAKKGNRNMLIVEKGDFPVKDAWPLPRMRGPV